MSHSEPIENNQDFENKANTTNDTINNPELLNIQERNQIYTTNNNNLEISEDSNDSENSNDFNDFNDSDKKYVNFNKSNENNTLDSKRKIEMEKRMKMLRFKLNKAREDNLKEVVKEKAQFHTKFSKKLDTFEEFNSIYNKSKSKHDPNDTYDSNKLEHSEDSVQEKIQDLGVEGKAQLNITIAQSESKQNHLKRKRKNIAKEGWEMNQDRYNAMKKRSKHISYTMNEYKEAMKNSSNQDSPLLNTNDEEDYKDRMATELLEYENQRKKFNRRREFFENENVDYINEKNRIYNLKTEKAYGKHTQDIKQKLERGTNL